MQSAADAAALAGVNTYVNSLYAKKNGKTTAELIALTTVQNYVTAQGQTQNQSISADFSDTPPTVGVEIDGIGTATFTKLLGATDANISAKSVAVTSANTTAACVIGLEASASPAVNFQLSGNFTANGCAVWSNSTQSIALSGSSSGTATATKFCAVGGATQGSTVFSVPPEGNCDPADDPLADVAMPTIGLCDYNNYTISTSGTVTLDPGVYCGGLKFNSQAQVQLNPGNYVIKDGPFSIVGGSSVTGTGITFLLTGTNSGLKFGGASVINITAPTSGTYAGIAIFSNRNSPADTSRLIGSTSLDIEGVVYLPNQDLIYSGSSSSLMPAAFTVLVARTVSFQGSSDTVIRSDFASSDVPVPEAILQERIFARLIK